jgi:hypothetical protein
MLRVFREKNLRLRRAFRLLCAPSSATRSTLTFEWSRVDDKKKKEVLRCRSLGGDVGRGVAGGHFFLLDQSIDLDVLYRMVRVSQIVTRRKYFFCEMRL